MYELIQKDVCLGLIDTWPYSKGYDIVTYVFKLFKYLSKLIKWYSQLLLVVVEDLYAYYLCIECRIVTYSWVET
jgi:hypothetical protein